MQTLQWLDIPLARGSDIHCGKVNQDQKTVVGLHRHAYMTLDLVLA